MLKQNKSSDKSICSPPQIEKQSYNRKKTPRRQRIQASNDLEQVVMS